MNNKDNIAFIFSSKRLYNKTRNLILLTWVQRAHYLVGMVRPGRDGTAGMEDQDLNELRMVEVREVVWWPCKK